MRRSALLLLPCVSWLGACSLDWGSLEPDSGGEPVDGSGVGDVFKATDAHPDTAPSTDAADDVTSEDSGNDGPSTDDAPTDGPVDAGTDAFDSGVIDASDGGGVVDAADASDGSAGSDASDGSADAGCPYTITGTLATWNLSTLSGTTTTPVAATSTASGITAGALDRASGLTPQSAAGGYNSSGWSTGASPDPTLYYTFSLTPPAQCAMAITSVYLDTLSSTTGPGYFGTGGDVATSADGYTAMSAFTPDTPSTVTLSVSGATGIITVRVYGFNAEKTTGTMRIQNTMTVSGSLK